MGTEDSLNSKAILGLIQSLNSLDYQDLMSPNRNSARTQILKNDVYTRQLSAEAFHTLVAEGNLLEALNPNAAQEEKKKKEQEEQRAIFTQAEKEKVRQEVVRLNEEYVRVEAKELAAIPIRAELTQEFIHTSEAQFVESVKSSPKVAETTMQKIDKAYTPVVEQTNLLESYRNIPKEALDEKDRATLKAKEFNISQSLREVNIAEAGAAGQMSKIVEKHQPDIHSIEKSAGSDFTHTAHNMITLGRMLKGKETLSYDEYSKLLEEEKKPDSKGRVGRFSKLGNEALAAARALAQEMGITESNSRYTSLQEFLAANPQLEDLAQKKIDELQKAQDKLKASNNQTIATQLADQKSLLGTPDTAPQNIPQAVSPQTPNTPPENGKKYMRVEGVLSEIHDPNQSQAPEEPQKPQSQQNSKVASFTSSSGDKFFSTTIVTGEDGQSTTTTQTFDRSTGKIDVTIDKSTTQAETPKFMGQGTGPSPEALAEAAQRLRAMNATIIQEQTPADNSRDAAKAEGAKLSPKLDLQVDTTAGENKAAPTTPAQAPEKTAEQGKKAEVATR